MDSDRHGSLADRFAALVARLGGRGGNELYARLAGMYAESHRCYHDLAHVARCLRELDDARDLAHRPDEVEASIYFHDAIYDPRANDNEERSALLAEEELTGAGVAAEVATRVADLIRATVHHEVPTDPDAALVVDIDLAGLADPYDVFVATGQRVREEFSHVPEEDYTAGRREFFRAFLARPSIYATESFRERLEERARENLLRLIG